jgi:hypothetical protein
MEDSKRQLEKGKVDCNLVEMATGEESTVRKCCTRLGFSDGVGGQLAD